MHEIRALLPVDVVYTTKQPRDHYNRGECTKLTWTAATVKPCDSGNNDVPGARSSITTGQASYQLS